MYTDVVIIVFPSSARIETATPSIGVPSADVTLPLSGASEADGPFPGDCAAHPTATIATTPRGIRNRSIFTLDIASFLLPDSAITAS